MNTKKRAHNGPDKTVAKESATVEILMNALALEEHRSIIPAMAKKSVYLETSFISYLTSRPSQNVVAAGHQEITRQWWDTRQQDFELFVSELVIEEAGKGHSEAAAKRLSSIADIALLDVTDEAITFANTLVEALVIPEKATADAMHVSIAAISGIHYLLTWNCRHIANVEIFESIGKLCTAHGYRAPMLCTPEQLLGDLA